MVLIMEMIKCRTCLKLADKHECLYIGYRCYLDESIKQALLHLVPEMALSLRDDDMVCRKCFRTLKLCVKFIKTCLTVETILADNKFIPKYVVKEELDLSGDECKVDMEETEDIIIQVDSDHNYHVKDDIEDGGSNISNFDEVKNENYCNTNDTEEFQLNSLINNDNQCIANNFESPFTIIFEEEEEEELKFKSNLEDKSELDSALGLEDVEEADKANKELEDNFSCSICSEQFSDEKQHKLHKETHTVLCQFCGKTFPEENSYSTHMSQHKKCVLKVCEFCGKTLKGARSLKMHIAAMHEEPSPHICDKCPKSFKHKYKVNLHVKEVHERSTQQQCSVCGKLFANLERCKSHYRLVHLKLKPHVCSVCGTKFGRKDYLDKHKAELHGNEKQQNGSKPRRVPKHGVRLRNPGKPVFCRVCGKEIASVHLLKAHLENHVKIKRYKCKYCELTFSVNNNKKRHEKLHESDPENKFRCNICWKRVKTEEELEEHVNSHDRPPQYTCDTCGEQFHRRYLLTNHIAKKHTSLEDIERAVEEIVIKNLLEYADPASK